VYRIEGWRGLFKGLGPNLSGVVPARAINFYTYGNGKRIIAERFNGGQESPLVHLCAAACAGIVTGTATNPIWLVKTRLQLDKQTAGKDGKSRQYKNSYDCVRQVVRQEGFKGLYRGLSASYLGVTESTLQWVLYERMKTYLAQRKQIIVDSGRQMSRWDEFVDTGGKLGAAGAAKLFAAALTYPHEVVRTRMRQRPLNNGKLKYTGLIQCFRTIWKEEGIVSMYGGLSPHLVSPLVHPKQTAGLLIFGIAPCGPLGRYHVRHVRSDPAPTGREILSSPSHPLLSLPAHLAFA
jgi:solute carrier family 25 protein 33/36